MKTSWPLSIVINTGAVYILSVATVMANPEQGYLSYQNPAANSAPSALSTISYIFSLIFTFAVVVGLAYFTSKFLSQRWSQTVQSKNMVIRDMITLGPNKSLCLVEIGGKVLLLGVADQNITYLQEYADEKFVETLRENGSTSETSGSPSFQNVFQQQIDALQRLTSRSSGQSKER